MPTDAAPLSLIGAVVDLQRQSRRQATRNTAGAPIWEFDTYTITGSGDTTHTLTYLPYGINVVLLNGLGLVEGTDYSCDYTTGVVTVTATLTAGDVLHVRYVTTGDLMVAATTPDIGAILDDFSGSTLNSMWIILRPTWGVTGGQAYTPSVGGGAALMVIDVGSPNGTVQATVTTLGGSSGVGIGFRASDASNFWFFALAGTSAYLYKVVANGYNLVGTWTTGASAGDVLAVVMSGTSITVKRNGTTVGSTTDSFNSTATEHGLYSESTAARFDNFSWTP